jgi:hypothetical protein
MDDVNCLLSGIWTRDEIRSAEQVQTLIARHPFTTTHDFVFHHRDMRSRTTKSRRAESQEK